MENRRQNTRNSTPFKNERQSRASGGKPYGRDNQRSKNYKGSNSAGRPNTQSARFQNSNDSRFDSKKRFTPKGKSKQAWKEEPLAPIVSEKQITDGKHRAKFLKHSESPKVQMTVRSIREKLFRIIFRQVRAGRFLDLCAGSGTIGIEAISRGAIVATFVERSAKLCSLIKENLTSCEIKEGHGEVFEMEVIPFLKNVAKRRRFWDVVFYDPPYDTDYESVLKYLERGVSIKPRGILVIKHHAEMFFPENIGVLKRWKVIVQDDTALSFYDRQS